MDNSGAQRKRRYLEFEKPLQELDAQIAQLKALKTSQVDVSTEIKALESKSESLLKDIFAKLSPYQVVQLARHPDRPSSLDYIQMISDDFIELHGDRLFMEDASIVGGIASVEGRSVMIIGHQKGRSTQENMLRNFGMPRPEGYRKAMRLFDLAERFRLPLITFIDTPGAYPGLDAEERGQAQAIAANIIRMVSLRTPIVSFVVGEGGSGGALAIAVADRLIMLQNSIYSVISPEGCAAITWKDGSHMARAAEALKLTAPEILKSKVADDILPEPLGGAHRDPLKIGGDIRAKIRESLKDLEAESIENLLEKRYQKYRRLGAWQQSGMKSV